MAREAAAGLRTELFEKMTRMGLEKIWLRFWDIFPGHVQNDLKTLGRLCLGRDLNFLKNAKNLKNGSGKNLVTLLGHFGRSGAE